MMTPGFDPHLDIAKLAGLVTQEEEDYFKWFEAQRRELGDQFTPTKEQKEKYADIKGRRLKSKKTNFSATYGAGPAKIALTAGITVPEGKVLHKTYWRRNWAVKEIAEASVVKTIGDQMWLFNPVSQLWYSLRALKDRFSTLNQGTGVYCFDMWVKFVRQKGIRLCGQFHDEIIFPILKGTEEETRVKLLESVRQVNEQLKLNITLGISIDFGNNYAEIH